MFLLVPCYENVFHQNFLKKVSLQLVSSYVINGDPPSSSDTSTYWYDLLRLRYRTG